MIKYINLPRERKALIALYKAIENIVSIMDFQKLLQEVMDISIDILEAERGMIFLDENGDGNLEFKYGRNVESENIEDAQRYSKSAVFSAGSEQDLIFVSDAQKDLSTTEFKSLHKFKIRSLMCAPLRVSGKVKGVIYTDSRNPISDEDGTKRELLISFANLAARVIENIRIHEELRVAKEKLQKENVFLKEKAKQRFTFENIIGKSGRMQEVFEIVSKIAPGKANVLITGESGTGKELIAKAIHFNSPRKNEAFIDISCPSIPRELIESEFFGHERGAFTGADRMKKGKFELANRGTLFLDEIGDMSLATQTKLLRALQERRFTRVGGTNTICVDVRIISATSQDLEKAVKAGTFREDLFYRINVVPVHLPALRERSEDIPVLMEHFLKKFGIECAKNIKNFSREVLDIYTSYAWPGNVRQLENAMEYAVNMTQRETITAEDIPLFLRSFMTDMRSGENVPLKHGDFDNEIGKLEKILITQALAEASGNQSRAGQMLGITESRVRSKMRKLGIRKTQGNLSV